jgi:hypothetical protein
MSTANDPDRIVINYFVDEAGDPTLFNANGKILIGTEGCSSYFMLGKVDIDDPEALSDELNALQHHNIHPPQVD